MAYFIGKNDLDIVCESSESEDNRDSEENESYAQRPPRGILLNVYSLPSLTQDTEENVQVQTEDVFINYMYQSYCLETACSETPRIQAPQEFLDLSRNPLTPAAEIGRKLAHLGDRFAERYASDMDTMVSSLGDDDPYEAFAEIARRVFRGGIKWNRIIILLNFGYRMAMAKLQHTASDFSKFLSKIVSFIVKFIVSEKIAHWIAQQGGWVAAIDFTPGTPSSAFYLLSGLAALTVLSIVFYHRFL